MSTLLLALGLATGAAAAEPAVDGATSPVGPEPAVRREARMPYPDRLFYDRSVARSCTVDVTLGDKGRPDDVAVVACETDALGALTAKKLRRWRWAKDAAPGTTIRRTVVYAPPHETTSLPAPGTWRVRQGWTCQLRVGVDLGGEVVVDAVSGEDCGARGGAVAPPSPARVGRRAPAVCPFTMRTTDAGLVDVQAFRCRLPLAAWVRRVAPTLDVEAPVGRVWQVVLHVEPDPARPPLDGPGRLR